jgi:hypothetical protein
MIEAMVFWAVVAGFFCIVEWWHFHRPDPHRRE